MFLDFKLKSAYSCWRYGTNDTFNLEIAINESNVQDEHQYLKKEIESIGI